MCVAQFRDYCKASEFRSVGQVADLRNNKLKVRKETFHGSGRNWHYVTDLEKLEKLAKAGNYYALKELEEL